MSLKRAMRRRPSLSRGLGRDHAHLAADPKHLGAHIGITSVLHTDPSSARAQSCRMAASRAMDHVGWQSVRLLPACSRALEAVPQADDREARGGTRRRPVTLNGSHRYRAAHGRREMPALVSKKPGMPIVTVAHAGRESAQLSAIFVS